MQMKILNLTLIFFLLSPLGSAQELTLEALESRFDEETTKVEERFRENVQGLERNYTAALLRFENSARTIPDLDGVLAAQEEIKRVERGQGLRPSALSSHEEISRMQTMVRNHMDRFELARAEELMRLVTFVRNFSDNTSNELTQRGDIQTAVAWRDWGEKVSKRPDVLAAKALMEKNAARTEREVPAAPPREIHPALRGDPFKVINEPVDDFVDNPRAYVFGNEPKGGEKRVTASTPSAAGSGHTLMQGRLRLVDEEDMLSRYTSRWSSYRERSHLYVPRLQLNPLPGQTIPKSLVVFDLFKRGSGSRREIIRTDSVIIPPVQAGTQLVVDSGVYAYNSAQYRSSISGYRSDRATADQFYGFIVSVFDESGNLIFQRASDRALDSHARSDPPASEAQARPPREE
ncbi:MAG: hypothetical protein LAT83_13655 [Kiritimatiellae bacterium]|nr:hypothetical protein [Kiritimatiellia bacterium]